MAFSNSMSYEWSQKWTVLSRTEQYESGRSLLWPAESHLFWKSSFRCWAYHFLDFWPLNRMRSSRVLEIATNVPYGVQCKLGRFNDFSVTVWFRSGMVPSRNINYQKFGELMFGKIVTKKLIFMSNFFSVLFRHTRSRQTFDTWFHNLGPKS